MRKETATVDEWGQASRWGVLRMVFVDVIISYSSSISDEPLVTGKVLTDFFLISQGKSVKTYPDHYIIWRGGGGGDLKTSFFF